ncbi:MAG: malonate transporter subunit MadM [Planctomycetota bacterium]|nr:malonate transporter subunit MadM [Planctomycetota bacterium]
MLDAIESIVVKYSLLTAFSVTGVTIWVSYQMSERLTRGRLHGSAIAILIGLILAVVGGLVTGGKKGIADIPLFSGIGLMGGAMLRDLAIVATAFGVRMEEFRKGGVIGAVSLALGLLMSFLVGGVTAFTFGYRDATTITTIGAGAATYIVGPVTGAAIGASSEVIALSVAAGLVKAILVMTTTPFVARFIGLNNPRAAMIFGGVIGTNSGVMAGLAATDPKLVPYGAMTATFYTGLGCLLGPSVVYMTVRALVE